MRIAFVPAGAGGSYNLSFITMCIKEKRAREEVKEVPVARTIRSFGQTGSASSSKEVNI
jgi:hypothetical protein